MGRIFRPLADGHINDPVFLVKSGSSRPIDESFFSNCSLFFAKKTDFAFLETNLREK
jgi:hypothetical protein